MSESDPVNLGRAAKIADKAIKMQNAERKPFDYRRGIKWAALIAAVGVPLAGVFFGTPGTEWHDETAPGILGVEAGLWLAYLPYWILFGRRG